MTGRRGFIPVAEIYIAQTPGDDLAPDGEDIYPAEAKRLGIEGVVKFKLGIDEKRNVVQVKVMSAPAMASTKRRQGADAGQVQARRSTSDGRAVPCSLIWAYRFET